MSKQRGGELPHRAASAEERFGHEAAAVEAEALRLEERTREFEKSVVAYEEEVKRDAARRLRAEREAEAEAGEPATGSNSRRTSKA